MKNKILLMILSFFFFSLPSYCQFDIIKKAEDAVEKKAEDSADKKSNEDSEKSTDSQQSQIPSTKTYQNYDFIPGDKIIFEDDFIEDQNGEFPSHWDLVSGQAQISNFQGENIFTLTEGNYVVVMPLLENDTYLNIDTFTVEFDFYTQPGAYNQVGIRFWNNRNEEQNSECSDEHNAVWAGKDCSCNGLSATYPEEGFENNKWHHIAIARKGNQLKVYEDQYRVLNVPVFKNKTYSLSFAGIGDQNQPIMLKNIRIAQGGSFNDTKQIMTENKIITHGILFDVDKATLKSESMGTINKIYQLMKDNPKLKFEIDGYTDNTGDQKHNLTLSQERAIAVKSQLVSMGIESSRLTAKGFGDEKPIADNSTLAGKANNRRVEFVKS